MEKVLVVLGGGVSDIRDLFKINQNPESTGRVYFDLQKRFSSLITEERSRQELQQILDILYKAYFFDFKKFVLDIFFEFQASKHKFKLHQDRIFEEMERLDEFDSGTKKEAMYLVNMYRAIVSDLFDPYITLIYASIQFSEGRFQSYIISNLGVGERAKVDYCASRLGESNMLGSYDPVVRNAVSHAGTDGISYFDTEVEFKSIKRGSPPIVDFVIWSNNELQGKILGLIRFTLLLDYAVDIFNLDISDVIREDDALCIKYRDEVISRSDREYIQKPFKQLIHRILVLEKKTSEEKLKILTNIFFLECSKADLKPVRLGFPRDTSTAFIEIRGLSEVEIRSHKEVVKSVMHALRYGVIAESCFKDLIDNYVILGEGEEQKRFGINAKSKIFSDYNNEQASLIDLATEVEAWVGNVALKVNADFKKLRKIEARSLGKRIQRRTRIGH